MSMFRDFILAPTGNAGLLLPAGDVAHARERPVSNAIRVSGHHNVPHRASQAKRYGLSESCVTLLPKLTLCGSSASQNSNVKLRDIASAVVTSVTGEPPQSPPFEDA
jgi:hypothetical protein